MGVDQAALRPQVEVVIEDARQLLELASQVHDQLELGPGSPRVDPDVPEVPTRRPVRELFGLEQRDRGPTAGEVVGRRGTHDAATDDQDVRRARHVPPFHARAIDDGDRSGPSTLPAAFVAPVCRPAPHIKRPPTVYARHNRCLPCVGDHGTFPAIRRGHSCDRGGSAPQRPGRTPPRDCRAGH